MCAHIFPVGTIYHSCIGAIGKMSRLSEALENGSESAVQSTDILFWLKFPSCFSCGMQDSLHPAPFSVCRELYTPPFLTLRDGSSRASWVCGGSTSSLRCQYILAPCWCVTLAAVCEMSCTTCAGALRDSGCRWICMRLAGYTTRSSEAFHALQGMQRCACTCSPGTLLDRIANELIAVRVEGAYCSSHPQVLIVSVGSAVSLRASILEYKRRAVEE